MENNLQMRKSTGMSREEATRLISALTYEEKSRLLELLTSLEKSRELNAVQTRATA